MATASELRNRVLTFHREHPSYAPRSLRALRNDLFMSQSEFASLAKISRETVIRIEARGLPVNSQTVKKIADATGFDPLVMADVVKRSVRR